MPALATLEELKAVEASMKEFQASHPEAYTALAAIMKKHRSVGYKNICKLLLGEATPEKLKGDAGN
jgi:hypothetical protein